MLSDRQLSVLLLVAILAGYIYQTKGSEKYQDEDKEKPKGIKDNNGDGYTYEEELTGRDRYQPENQKKGKNPPMPKSAVSILNELKPGSEYKFVSQTGPSHLPEFTMSLTVDGKIYIGTGKTKKEAKEIVAQQALKDIKIPDHKDKMDFSDFEGMNPVEILNELRPGLKYEVVSESGESHTKEFVIAVTVDGMRFEGSGPNKRTAKANAAQKAVKKIFNIESKLPHGKSSFPWYTKVFHLY